MPDEASPPSPPTFETLSLSAAARTVWIFGAGASACPPYKVPTQLGLLQHIDKMKRTPGSTPELRAEFKGARERLPEWVRRVQPGRDWLDWRVCLEEVFSHYELVHGDTENASPAERAEARQALHDLRLAVRAATSVSGRIDGPRHRALGHRGRERAPYAELVEALLTDAGEHQPANFATQRHAFVTMNYDINLDRCLLYLKAGGLGTTVDYGIPLLGPVNPDQPEGDEPDPAFTLLRVHGSMNWKRCTACHAVVSTGAYHAEIQPGEPCVACGAAEMSYLLVNPSYTRVYDDPAIAAVWRRARAELMAADRWVFIGYSLPAADVHFRSLLRDCIARRRVGGMDTEVVQVGRRPSAKENKPRPDEFDLAVDAYSALFAGAVRFWDATPGGFADFVRGLRG